MEEERRRRRRVLRSNSLKPRDAQNYRAWCRAFIPGRGCASCNESQVED